MEKVYALDSYVIWLNYITMNSLEKLTPQFSNFTRGWSITRNIAMYVTYGLVESWSFPLVISRLSKPKKYTYMYICFTMNGECYCYELPQCICQH